MSNREPTCELRVDAELRGRIKDIKRLWSAHRKGSGEGEELYDFGLSFDYVAPETFDDQLEGYWRYMLSYGGPSDEFRFFASGPNDPAYRIEYVFMDWFDGAVRTLAKGSKERALMDEIWGWFQEAESTLTVYDEARA